MKLLHEVLQTVEFLSDGPPELAAEFMSLGRLRTLARNHVLWRAGQTPEFVVVPVTGELAALGRDTGGRGICYAFFGTGDCVGVPAAVDGLTQPREVRVIRGGDFFTVDRRSFARFLESHPGARARVTTMIGRLFRRSLEERDRDVFLPVHARVARFLLESACIRRSDGARILVRESQPEIAIRLGSVREVIAREMAGLAEQGLIRRTRHALFIVDWAGLTAKAGCVGGDPCDCSCETATAALRTKRFFLPALEGGQVRIAGEAAVCSEHVAGFRACIASGCPLAQLSRCGATSPTDDPLDSRHDVRFAPPAPRPAEPHEAAATTPTAPMRAHRPRHHSQSQRPVRDRASDETATRNPAEEQEIRRRIEIYRQRVSGIESRFGGEVAVPAEASVFDEPEAVEA